MSNPNLEMLGVAVKNLGDLVAEMVFAGVCTTGLLITNEGAAEVPVTDEVDSIVVHHLIHAIQYVFGKT